MATTNASASSSLTLVEFWVLEIWVVGAWEFPSASSTSTLQLGEILGAFCLQHSNDVPTVGGLK